MVLFDTLKEVWLANKTLNICIQYDMLAERCKGLRRSLPFEFRFECVLFSKNMWVFVSFFIVLFSLRYYLEGDVVFSFFCLCPCYRFLILGCIAILCSRYVILWGWSLVAIDSCSLCLSVVEGLYCVSSSIN